MNRLGFSGDGELSKEVEVITSLSALYSLRMRELNIPLEYCKDTLTSGWLCVLYYLSLFRFFSVKAPCGSRADFPVIFERTISFVALYLLVDHYLDARESNSKQDKLQLLQWLQDPSIDPPQEKWRALLPHLDILGREHIPELVKMVVDSYQAQTGKLTTKQYLQACRQKGSVTSVIGVKMIYDTPMLDTGTLDEKDLARLGYCAQLLDDITDCSDDLTNGINTACTHQVKKRGNVDHVVWELLYELTLLPSELRMHMVGLQWMTVYVCGRSKHVSKLTRRVLGLVSEKEIGEKCLREKIEKMLRRGYAEDC